MPHVSTPLRTVASVDTDWVADPDRHQKKEPARATWWGLTQSVALKVAVVVAILGVAGVAAWKLAPSPAPVQVPDGLLIPAPADAVPSAPASPGSGPALTNTAFVHVAGAVENPGLVELPENSRVADALEHSGGPAPGADLGAINLAAPIADGEQVYVPTLDEDHPPAGSTDAQGLGNEEPGTVNINTAGEGELQQLSGIGPVLAERIATYRDANGPFASVDDLQAVPGIGPKLMAELRTGITV